jgi:hypothetical protein
MNTEEDEVERQLTGAEYCEQAGWHYREAARHSRLGNRFESVRHGRLAALHLRTAVEHVLGMLQPSRGRSH